jgi:hypothetical protein
MAQPVTPIPIEHHPVTHEITTSFGSDSQPVTLFDLVAAVSEVTDDENEIVATVDWMLASGRVKLIHAPSPKRSETTPLQALAILEELDLPAPARQLA